MGDADPVTTRQTLAERTAAYRTDPIQVYCTCAEPKARWNGSRPSVLTCARCYYVVDVEALR